MLSTIQKCPCAYLRLTISRLNSNTLDVGRPVICRFISAKRRLIIQWKSFCKDNERFIESKDCSNKANWANKVYQFHRTADFFVCQFVRIDPPHIIPFSIHPKYISPHQTNEKRKIGQSMFFMYIVQFVYIRAHRSANANSQLVANGKLLMVVDALIISTTHTKEKKSTQKVLDGIARG